MTTFQLLLFIIAGGILYLFFKQLFSGNHPKRGIDFEAKTEDTHIGGINRPDKTFARPRVEVSRIEQLLVMADEAMEKNDFDEASKALGSALIIEPKNAHVLQKMGYVYTQTQVFTEAKSCYETLLSIDANDDMAHVLLANTLHSMGENSAAEVHHKKAIALDEEYAGHYFNYANTLYDSKRYSDALVQYQKAYALDDTLSVAKEMIEELEAKHA
ncbi:MAG: tetratricopeptide repeat protein [Sulfurovum sp.]|nr:tetratricopeptide repeat protein [Sulfurovum sp.]